MGTRHFLLEFCSDISFSLGTFATCGADGVINFWDKDNKQRLKGFGAIQRTISTANFNQQVCFCGTS